MVVAIHGELDVATVPTVADALEAITAIPRTRLIVDLRPTDFIDCSALSLLCRTRRRVTARGGQLLVVCTRPWHLRIIKVSGLHSVLRPTASLKQAYATASVSADPAATRQGGGR
jgi:anti-sigma B factor antagonist